MSVSVDKDGGDGGESPRTVLSGWLNDYSAGRCERAAMQTSFLDICRSNPEAPWDALALLDQYQRRGRIDGALARSLKSDIAQLVFGASNQTEGPREPAPRAQNPANTTGSGWRKQPPPQREAPPPRAEPVADPTLFRRDFDPPSRPPPRVREVSDDQTLIATSSRLVAPQPAPVPTATPGSILRDRYELLEIIGRGKVGNVYKAFDRHRSHLPGPARYVAVKVLRSRYEDQPEAIAELERESYEAQSLSHPNIVSVFDLDRHNDTYFIVMELLEGELLSSVLRWLDGRPLVRDRALSVIGTIGGALAHAHQRNIVHADLKPANVMVTNSGELKLLDFGFARRHVLEPWVADSDADETAPSTTPAYASSERVNNEEPHPSDDVYSFACIAYELLSGAHPFGGRSAPLARAHGREPARIPGLTNKQWYALQNALCWTRSERRIDVVELTAALACPPPPQRVGSPQELIAAAGKSGGGSTVWVVSGVVLTLVVLAAIAWTQFGDLIDERFHSVVAQVRNSELMSPAPAPQPSPAAAPLTRDAPGETGIRESESASTPAQTPPTAPPEQPQEQASAPSPVAANSRPAARSAPVAAADEAADTASGAAQGTIEFEKDTFVATESDGTVRLSVKRTGSTKRPAKFRWTLHSNSAVAGEDFAAIGPEVEEIPAGVRTAVLTIPLVNDGLVENTELFLVELSQAEGGPAVGEQARAAVIIVDDD
jgi:hypothetical protein